MMTKAIYLLHRIDTRVREHLARLPGWWIFVVAALIVLRIIAPQQMAVLLYKVCQISVAFVLGYVADKTAYRFAPEISKDMPRDAVSAARLKSRAYIIGAVIIGVTIGI